MEPVRPSKADWRLALRWLKLEQAGEVGCEDGESVVVGTASLAVSPPGDSGEVSELTAVNTGLGHNPTRWGSCPAVQSTKCYITGRETSISTCSRQCQWAVTPGGRGAVCPTW